MLEIIMITSFFVLAISFLFNSAAKGEMKKDEGLATPPTEKMIKMQKTTRRLMGYSGATFLILLAVAFALPPKESAIVDSSTEKAEASDEGEGEEVAEPIDYKQIVREVADVKEMEAALKKVEDSVESVRLEGNLAIIRYKSDESTWSENTLVKEFATDSTEILALLDENPFYKDVAFERFGTLVDDQGNERESGLIKALYLESDVTKLNFENFTDMVWTDVSKFYNNATGYAIYGAIYTEIETDLQYSMGWANDPETDLYNVYF